MSFSAYIGTVRERLSDVALRIHRLPAEVPIVVWIDSRGDVYAAPTGSAPSMPTDALVGHYGRSRSPRAVEDDLKATSERYRRNAVAPAS